MFSQNKSYLNKKEEEKTYKTSEAVFHNTNGKQQNEPYLLLFVFPRLASKNVNF